MGGSLRDSGTPLLKPEEAVNMVLDGNEVR